MMVQLSSSLGIVNTSYDNIYIKATVGLNIYMLWKIVSWLALVVFHLLYIFNWNKHVYLMLG